MNESIIYSLNKIKLIDFLHLPGTLLHAEEDTGMKKRWTQVLKPIRLRTILLLKKKKNKNKNIMLDKNTEKEDLKASKR